MKPQKTARDFLNDTGAYWGSFNPNSLLKEYLNTMKLGLAEKGSSLEMIPTYIPYDHPVPTEKPVAVIDAGGTNLRVARLRFDNEGKVHFEKVSKHPMPGREEELGRKAFFDTLAEAAAPVIDPDTPLGFCFSYATEVFPNRDGRLIRWSKEVKAPEVEGEVIGEGLIAALKRRGHSAPGSFAILNDTTATLLAGKTSAAPRQCGDFIGFILGTGINSCYGEDNRNIAKINSSDSGKQIINLESGSYGNFPQGEGDKRFANSTQDPRFYLQEKMASGRYFGPMVCETLKVAVEKGIFPAAVSATLLSVNEIKTFEADDYLHNPNNPANTIHRLLRDTDGESREVVYHIIDALLERAALFTAINMGAVTLKSGGGTSPIHPICITVDGTTFYAYNNFKKRVHFHLKNLLTDENERFIHFNCVDDGPLIGAGIAALGNKQ